MADEIQFEAFEAAAPSGPTNGSDLGRLRDVPVELAVEIGRMRMTIGDTLALGAGSIVALNRLAGEPVDLLVNGKRIARGEVVVIDEEFGLRVTEVVSVARRLENAQAPEPDETVAPESPADPQPAPQVVPDAATAASAVPAPPEPGAPELGLPDGPDPFAAPSQAPPGFGADDEETRL